MTDELRRRLRGFTRPHLGQLVTWGLIYLAIAHSPRLPLSLDAPRAPGPVSVLSFLPDALLSSALVFDASLAILFVAGVIWALQVLLPWSSWLTVAACTVVGALHVENASRVHHVFHLTHVLLFVHALWYHFHHREIREALRRGVFWQSEICPAWAFHLSVLCIGAFHTFAGVSKLMTSGVQWADGVSLQLWLHLWGRRDSVLSSFLLAHRDAAVWLQVATLVVETGAVLAIVSARLRVAVGVGLLGLYAGISESFGFLFQYNAVLVAAFLLPTGALVDTACRRARAAMRVEVRLTGGRVSRALCRFVVSRLDLPGIVTLIDEPRRGAPPPPAKSELAHDDGP